MSTTLLQPYSSLSHALGQQQDVEMAPPAPAFRKQSISDPSSYSRNFLNSPIDWRGGSFGSRFYPACSPGQLLAPLDPRDIKLNHVSSSIESDLGIPPPRGAPVEECKNYTCCGLNLMDLHALVDHFEDKHVLLVDNSRPIPPPPTYQGSGAFDPEDMEMDDGSPGPSSGASTPPPITPHSPRGSPPPVSAFDPSVVRGNGLGYSTYSDTAGCVPPTALYSPSGSQPNSRTGSPTPRASSSADKSAKSAPRASTTLARPSTSLLLSKPFKCPKANCNKSYKQANGLKYHITHGSCSFAPAKEVAELNAVLAQRGRDTLPADMNASELDLSSLGVTEREAREIEREAERRLKPFACGIADCTRRYKNMNGLRYHYQHSGDHGAIGLALLASGQHECLRNGTSKPIRSHTVTNAINAVTALKTPGYTPTPTPTTTQAPQLPSTAPAAMPNVYATAAGTLPFSFMPQQPSAVGQQNQQPTAATQSYLAYPTGIFGNGAPASVSPAPLSAAATTMQY